MTQLQRSIQQNAKEIEKEYGDGCWRKNDNLKD